MKDFLKTKKFRILVVITLLLVGLMIYTISKGGFASGASSFFDTVSEPVKKLSAKISDSVSTSLDTLANGKKYRLENEKLKEQLNELYNDIADYDSVKEENEELRSMLELKEQNNDFTFSAPAQIISRLTNDPFAAFVIDKGMADGVNPYDPVVTSQGLVGICYDVSYTTSKVRTMFSPKTAVGVITVRTKATGIVEGDYTTAKDGYYKMRYIDKEADVKSGDIVMTSGSKTYPAKQLVGIVKEMGIEENGLSRYAVIEPAENPAHISKVFVITDFEGQGADISEEVDINE